MRQSVAALTFVLWLTSINTMAYSQQVISDVPYSDTGHKLQALDIYSPPDGKDLPVIFWIHGGGWVTGDKLEVQIKPRAFTRRGFVFVSTNYRLIPEVPIEDIFRDVAKALGYVHKHIHEHGGDPARIFVMGHSAGAQLAALMCTNDRYLKSEGVAFQAIRGCVPVDGDTYDVPAIILTAETRQAVHQLPAPEFGHRIKFGNDPKKHIDYSAVTHVAKGKEIPPFLILHVAGQPDVTAQAKRFGSVLASADVPVKVFGAKETTHNQLNANLGADGDPATIEVFAFLDRLVKKGR